jgi:hypothetical protein
MKIEKEETLTLRGPNGKFVCADAGYEGKVIVNRDHASTWETFHVLYLDGQCLIRTWDEKWLYTGTDHHILMSKYPPENSIFFTCCRWAATVWPFRRALKNLLQSRKETSHF